MKLRTDPEGSKKSQHLRLLFSRTYPQDKSAEQVSCAFFHVFSGGFLQSQASSSSQETPINKYKSVERSSWYNFSIQHRVFPKAAFLSCTFNCVFLIKLSVPIHSKLTTDRPALCNKITGQQALKAATFSTRLPQVLQLHLDLASHPLCNHSPRWL